MKKSFIILIVSLLLAVFAIIMIKENVPMHFDSNGEITRYGSKYELLIFPAIILVLIAFWEFLAKISSKGITVGKSEMEVSKANINANLVRIAGLLTIFGVFVSQVMTILVSMKFISTNHIRIFMGVSVGIIIIASGFITSKTGVNKIIGVRTNNTLKNKDVWDRVNDIVGKILIVMGFIVVIFSFSSLNFNIVIACVILIIIISTFVCSSICINKK